MTSTIHTRPEEAVARPAVTLTSMCKGYKGVPVVQDLSLQVFPGEMVALVGPSGCGKSTTLNVIGLLEHADSGSVKLFGKPAPRLPSRAARDLLQQRIGYLFQNFALIDNESVAVNLQVATRYAQRKVPNRIDEVLRKVGLEGMQRRKVFELSGGEQQRVALARLMLKPCDLILADEPTGSLDSQNRDDVLSMLRDLSTQGAGIIIVTHEKEVSQQCSRTITFRDRPAPHAA